MSECVCVCVRERERERERESSSSSIVCLNNHSGWSRYQDTNPVPTNPFSSVPINLFLFKISYVPGNHLQ